MPVVKLQLTVFQSIVVRLPVMSVGGWEHGRRISGRWEHIQNESNLNVSYCDLVGHEGSL